MFQLLLLLRRLLVEVVFAFSVRWPVVFDVLGRGVSDDGATYSSEIWKSVYSSFLECTICSLNSDVKIFFIFWSKKGHSLMILNCFHCCDKNGVFAVSHEMPFHQNTFQTSINIFFNLVNNSFLFWIKNYRCNSAVELASSESISSLDVFSSWFVEDLASSIGTSS
jgi:hypothetical protein